MDAVEPCTAALALRLKPAIARIRLTSALACPSVLVSAVATTAVEEHARTLQLLARRQDGIAASHQMVAGAPWIVAPVIRRKTAVEGA